MRKILILTIYLVTTAFLAAAVHPAYCQNNELSDQLSELLSNPISIAIFLTQLGLGFGLGYFSMKALKYIIALVCIFALGILLNIWQFGGLEGFLSHLGLEEILEISRLTAMLQTIASILGILTILPIGVGFFVGAIMAARK